jgi:hypothetical protein
MAKSTSRAADRRGSARDSYLPASSQPAWNAATVSQRIALRARQLATMATLWRANRTSRRPAVAPGGPVVSLTSFGVRARTVAFTIESIAQGELLPSRLILWLDEPALLASPSLLLRRLQERGVELRSTENWGPHKKYYPFVASQATFDAPLVTADDDVLYPASWLSGLSARYAADHDSVHCYRARVVALNGGGFAPYSSWRECSSNVASHRHFSIGMAGVLLPPQLLQDLRRSGSAFASACPRTDDIWLNLHAQRAGVRVRQVHATPEYFLLLPGTQRVGLLHSNVAGGNDAALAAVYGPADLARLQAAD